MSKKTNSQTACFVLPGGYQEECRLDMQKDRRLVFLINGLALCVFLIGGIIGHLFVPIQTFYSMSEGMLMYFVRLAAVCGGWRIRVLRGICLGSVS